MDSMKELHIVQAWEQEGSKWGGLFDKQKT